MGKVKSALQSVLPTVLAVVAVIAYFEFKSRTDAPTTKPYDAAFTKVGKSYGKSLNLAYAEGYEAAADVLEKGGTVSQSTETLKSVALKSRSDEFTKSVQPGLARILPEGAEPTSPTQREAFVKAYRGFARGLRGYSR